MPTTPEQLRKLVKNKKGSLAFAWLADLEHRAGRTADALQLLEAGLQQFPNHVSGWVVKGNILRKQGDTSGSRECFQKVLELDTFHLNAMLQLAEIHMELAEGEDAYFLLQDLKEIDSLASDIPEVPKDLLPKDFSVTSVKTSNLENIFPTQELLVSLDDSFLDNSFDDLDGEKPPFELQAELEAALANAPTQDSSSDEFFPEGPISSDTGVVPLFNTMFGAEEAEPPKPPVLDRISTTPTAQTLLSTVSVNEAPTIESVVDTSLFNEPTSSPEPIIVPEPPSKDLSSAMDELFGDDDVAPSPVSSFATSAPKDESGLLEGVSGALADMFGQSEDDDLPFEQSSISQMATNSDESPLEGGISNALDDLLGADDESLAPNQNSSESISSLFDSAKSESALEESNSLFEKAPAFAPPKDEGPMGGVSNALDDLFGPEEDDLPTDSMISKDLSSSLFGDAPQENPVKDDIESPFEKAPSFEPPKDEGPMGGVSNALDDLFGSEDDELPEETKTSDLSSSLFDSVPEKNVLESDLDNPFEKAPSFAPPKDEGPMGGVSNALDDLFGPEDDELPLESKTDSSLASSLIDSPPPQEELAQDAFAAENLESAFEKAPTFAPPQEESISAGLISNPDDLFGSSEEETLQPSPAFIPPVLEDEPIQGLNDPLDDLFGPVDAEEDMGGDATMQELGSLLDEALPEAEPEADTIAEPGSFGSSVGNAFDDLFGEETIQEDALVEEASNSILGGILPEPEVEGAHLDESLAQSLIEDPTKPFQEQENTPEKDDVSSAFDSLFGEDDEYIEEESLQATLPTLTLAEVYETQGHLEQALQVYMSLQEKDPSTPGIAEKIESIKSRLG